MPLASPRAPRSRERRARRRRRALTGTGPSRADEEGRRERELAVAALVARRDHWSGRSIKLARVPELTPDRNRAAPSTVHFEIARDAGTFVCDGRVGNGDGAGLYDLKLDPTYGDALASAASADRAGSSRSGSRSVTRAMRSSTSSTSSAIRSRISTCW
jgi:hypothetical protein